MYCTILFYQRPLPMPAVPLAFFIVLNGIYFRVLAKPTQEIHNALKQRTVNGVVDIVIHIMIIIIFRTQQMCLYCLWRIF